MTNISIFAKGAFLNTRPNEKFVYNGTKPGRGYLKRVSSIIHADQIADYLGARLNPADGEEDEVCIYVKPEGLGNGIDYKFKGKRPYLDIIDNPAYLPILRMHPEIDVIVCSERDYITLYAQGITNKIVLIPQHHCNYDRERRMRKEIKTVGVIGTSSAFPYLPADLKPRLAERQMELIEFSQFFTRQDIIDFYKRIDIQIVWRPYRIKMGNPLKIVNAASFGIPTIALDEIFFKEMGNCYIGVSNFDQFLVELDRIRNSPDLYRGYAELCREKAENYHIENIAMLYEEL